MDAALSGEAARVRSVFASHRQELLEFMDQDDVDGVIEGRLDATCKLRSENERYLLLAHGDVLHVVYPFQGE